MIGLNWPVRRPAATLRKAKVTRATCHLNRCCVHTSDAAEGGPVLRPILVGFVISLVCLRTGAAFAYDQPKDDVDWILQACTDATCSCGDLPGPILDISNTQGPITAPPGTVGLVAHRVRADRIGPLPLSLRCLDVSGAAIGRLGALPSGLKILIAADTRIRTISYLPSGLVGLDVSNTQVSSLSYLPAGLLLLNAAATPVTSVSYLPARLSVLDVSDTQVSSLSYLPSGLAYLDASRTRVRGLRGLPSDLRVLRASGVPITSWSQLPRGVRLVDHTHSDRCDHDDGPRWRTGRGHHGRQHHRRQRHRRDRRRHLRD